MTTKSYRGYVVHVFFVFYKVA